MDLGWELKNRAVSARVCERIHDSGYRDVMACRVIIPAILQVTTLQMSGCSTYYSDVIVLERLSEILC